MQSVFCKRLYGATRLPLSVPRWRRAAASHAVLRVLSELREENLAHAIQRTRSNLPVEATVSSFDHLEEFGVFSSLGPAEALLAQLELNQVPAKIEARALEGCIERQYCVLVSSRMAHRARWILAQSPPTDEELIFLATGKLPGQNW
jgi:hypothetical protein